METVESSKVPRQEEGSKAIRRFRITGLSSRINDFDLKDLFSNYGTIGRIDSKITLAYVQVKNGGIEQGNGFGFWLSLSVVYGSVPVIAVG
jgi:hypothetical protein